ncbi:sugar ABC transporter permease [Anaerocolumna cellulosilytica]|uniref:Sugar ABC transporter permease n=1 Tax=Anaerocolumna cellulosilytica TaxID=433286 RepID=A0A6S6QYR2_9FIRM|nr:carbohydrate ABC transporter permease [Anaerocolumna cellulosilytica]MBB5196115.1 putative aldouronate transport system permease protein [Anaerocolumna cellulosilytica]BCJ92565.1 sugar ABC transporter permease [Anaerocolumna cellulosilytica]
MKDKSIAYKIFTVCNTIVLTLIALACLYPFFYVVVASISDPNELIKHNGLLFRPLNDITFAGYKMVFNNKLVLSGYKNTMIILVVGLVFNLILTTMGAYVLSLKELMLRKPLTILVIITMYFSGGMVPAYLNIRSLGLMDSLWSLIIPGAISTSNLIIMRSAFMSVPESLSEAAKMDGASHGKILIKVMLPLVKATLAVMVLYYGVSHWNAWFNSSIYLRTSSKYPLQLVLRNILIESQTTDMMSDIGAAESPQVLQLLKYSLIVVSSLPIMAIYPFLQKFFQKGVMMGAVKG